VTGDRRHPRGHASNDRGELHWIRLIDINLWFGYKEEIELR
jgi:hypothetical protein